MKNAILALLIAITVVTTFLVAASNGENSRAADGNNTNNTFAIPFPTNQSNTTALGLFSNNTNNTRVMPFPTNQSNQTNAS